jgi:hypothetical protein
MKQGVINGLSNAYFGIWGSFFNSVFAFGTWLHENKHESILRDPSQGDVAAEASTTRTSRRFDI